MDEVDKKLLNTVQTDFPIASSPYKELAKKINLSEDEVFFRLEKLKKDGIIRQIGPVFSSKKLGYKSTLVAMKIPYDRVEEVAEIISSYPEVTHNYERDHKYNLWFTLICPSDGEIDRIIGEIKDRTGIEELFSLPYEKLFKIKVKFSF